MKLHPWEYVASFSPTGVLPLYSRDAGAASEGDWVRHKPPRFLYGDSDTILRDPPLLVRAVARSSVFRMRYADCNTYHLYVDAGSLARELEEAGVDVPALGGAKAGGGVLVLLVRRRVGGALF